MLTKEMAAAILLRRGEYAIDVADVLGVSVRSVVDLRTRLGLTGLSVYHERQNRESFASMDRAIDAVSSGHLVGAVAAVCKLSASQLLTKVRRLGISQRACSTGWIYGLRDGRTGERRYVGQSIDPWCRFEQHARSPHLPLRKWMRYAKPKLELIACVPIEDMALVERQWIIDSLASGCDLLNQHHTKVLST